MSAVLGATARINNEGPFPAELTVERNVERIPTLGRTVPDLAWSHVDKHGHYHAYAADGSLPTLDATRKHMPCIGCEDRACEGGYRTVYRCGLCKRKVKPGTTTSYDDTVVQGPAEATLVIREVREDTFRDIEEPVSATIDTGSQFGFGFGHLVSLVGEGSGTDWAFTATFTLYRFDWQAQP